MGSQLLNWLIHREAGGIGRDFKEDASRFAKVNRVEVLDARSHPLTLPVSFIRQKVKNPLQL
jgi:hypothetical protein